MQRGLCGDLSGVSMRRERQRLHPLDRAGGVGGGGEEETRVL